MVRISTFLFCLLLSITQLASATESVTYYHNDALGSPVAATDDNGDLLWEQGYTPWGEPLHPTDNNERWFTGAPYDDASALTYLQARWHSPAAGRFLAIDPVDFHEGNIHSFNRYAYGANNPYVYVDPDGNIPVPVIIWGAVKLGSAAIAAYETYQAYENAGAAAAVGTAAANVVGGPVRQAARGGRAVVRGSSDGVRSIQKQRGSIGGRQQNFFRELAEAEGRPHTVFRRNTTTGRIENYQTFDRTGAAGGNMRFRGTGKPHGGIEPPLVLSPRSNRPGGRPVRARPATSEELPSGF